MNGPRRLEGLAKTLVISGATLISLNFLGYMAANARLENGVTPKVFEKEYSDTFKNSFGWIGDAYLFITKPGRELAHYSYSLPKKKRIK